MSKIRILPEILTNKIAAGEVVERPGSVVKELLENSLDAGADRITIEVAEGGKSLIRVSDNGHGMDKDDALLCLERYATSKIATDDDLFEIRTLGFRGEALPSIASVSSLTLISRVAEAESAALINVEGGRMVSVSETGAPVGTVVTVKNLFQNVPARKKFLKSASTEMGHVAETVTSAALARPDVSFSLLHNGRTVFSWPTVKDPMARAHAVLGHETGPSLVTVNYESPAAKVSGFVAPPEFSRSTTRALFVFVNNRVVQDRLLIHAVMEGFAGRLTKGRYPLAVVSVQAPADEVDVNVHPAKAQVRFAKSREVHASVVRAVSSALAGSLAAVVPWMPIKEPTSPAPPFSCTKKADYPEGRQSVSAAAAIARDLGMGGPSVRKPFPPPVGEISHRTGEKTAQPASSHQKFAAAVSEPAPVFEAPVKTAPSTSRVQEPVFQKTQEQTRPFSVIGQLRSSYIICESDQGLMAVDQHAAHERILFERFKNQLLDKRIETEGLLFPETVELNHAEAEALSAIVEEIGKLGLEIEAFSGRTFVVKAVPAFLSGRPLASLVRQLAEKACEAAASNDLSKILDDCVALTACHGAIRAGRTLSHEEMKKLLSDLSLCRDPAHCPHGRPVWVVWSNDEMEKDFRRK